ESSPRLHRPTAYRTRPLIRTLQLRCQPILPHRRLKLRTGDQVLDTRRHRRHTLLEIPAACTWCPEQTFRPRTTPPYLQIIINHCPETRPIRLPIRAMRVRNLQSSHFISVLSAFIRVPTPAVIAPHPQPSYPPTVRAPDEQRANPPDTDTES